MTNAQIGNASYMPNKENGILPLVIMIKKRPCYNKIKLVIAYLTMQGGELLNRIGYNHRIEKRGK